MPVGVGPIPELRTGAWFTTGLSQVIACSGGVKDIICSPGSTILLTVDEGHAGRLLNRPGSRRLPAGARVIGRVLSPQSSPARVLGHRPGVLLAGEPAQEHTGWDHFSHT